MKEHKVLITGSCGLIGSEAVRFYLKEGYDVLGIDNDNRGKWFGQEGSVESTRAKLRSYNNHRPFLKNYKHEFLDINDSEMHGLIIEFKPNLIVHCAAQPSHEKSSEIPYETFKVNALGTINLLEAIRKYTPKTVFAFTSTNKVYLYDGVRTPFGATKYAADIMVQEYGNYFGLKTACFRCGCITGSAQKGVEAHGFLNYLCKCIKEDRPYTIFGFEGNQKRDNLHATDVIRAIDLFYKNPKKGAVYDIGGGKNNSCSILEAIKDLEKRTNKKLKINFGPARKGDFKDWITDNSELMTDYGWKPSISLDQIFEELVSNDPLP